jgi:hypothetical protein
MIRKAAFKGGFWGSDLINGLSHDENILSFRVKREILCADVKISHMRSE